MNESVLHEVVMIGGCTSIQDRRRLVEIHSRMDTYVMNFSCPYSIYGVSIRRQQPPYYCIYALHGAGVGVFTAAAGAAAG